MQLGDIVRATDSWRRQNEDIIERHLCLLELGIVVGLRNEGSILVRHASDSQHSYHDGAVSWSREYLELVYDLQSISALEIHQGYPQYQGHDYDWYLTQRRLLHADVAASVVPTTFVVGDVVRRVRVSANWSHESEFPLQQTGTVVEVGISGDRGHSRIRVTNTPWYGTSVLESADFELVTATSTAATLTPLHPDEWQVGDILEQVDSQNFTSSDIGRGFDNVPGTRYKVRLSGSGGGVGLFLSSLEGIELSTCFNKEAFVFVDRPGVEGMMRTVTRPEFYVGDRVRVTSGRYAGNIGGIYRLIHGGNSYLYLDGFPNAIPVNTTEIVRLTQEPEPAPLPAYFTSFSLSTLLHTREQLEAFADILFSLGYQDSFFTTDQGFGDKHNGPRKDTQGLPVILRVTGSQVYYSANVSSDNAPASLERDWNKLLLWAASKRGRTLEQLVPAKKEVPARTTGLSKLPPAFVLDLSQRAARDNADEWLARHGLRGYLGAYTLVKGNTAIGTFSEKAARNFLTAHNGVWFNGVSDNALLATLFNNRKSMLSTEASKQRFALDVAASGPHLIRAFALYMASIGYRQENTDKTDGTYILLNGGNLFANQPATWQYSDTKNNRNALLDLSEAPSHGKKSGWEKMCERLANRNVALPVLDPDDLDREPVANDTVILTNNAAEADLPETEETLRALTQGKQYTVLSVLNNMCYLKENHLRIHVSRFQVLEAPKGIQNGDLVKMATDYGDLLKADQVLTYMNKQLVDKSGNTFLVPGDRYQLLSADALTEELLKQAKLTLPFVAKVVTPDMVNSGNEVVITQAWSLNNQELAFWTEEQDMDAETISWYTRKDLQVHQPIGENEKATLIRGNSAETSYVQVGDTRLTLAELESIFI